MPVSYAKKYSIYPIDDPVSFRFYREQSTQMWDAEEIRIGEDKQEFNTFDDRMKEHIADILMFLGPGDGLISAQILGLLNKTKVFGQQAFLAYQMAIEVAHAHAYADAIAMFFSPSKAAEIFEAVDTLPCIRAKAEFIAKYMDDDFLESCPKGKYCKRQDLCPNEGEKCPAVYPIGQKYFAGAIGEGIFFVSLFAFIFRIMKDDKLKRFCFLNEQVAKDEKVHRDNNITMAKRFKEDVPPALAKEMLGRAIQIEHEFIKYVLRTPITTEAIDARRGLTVENLTRYVATLADHLSEFMGYGRMFTVAEGLPIEPWQYYEISLPWMVDCSLGRRTNMHEGDPADYQKVSLQEKVAAGDVGARAFADPCSMDI